MHDGDRDGPRGKPGGDYKKDPHGDLPSLGRHRRSCPPKRMAGRANLGRDDGTAAWGYSPSEVDPAYRDAPPGLPRIRIKAGPSNLDAAAPHPVRLWVTPPYTEPMKIGSHVGVERAVLLRQGSVGNT